MTSSLVGIYLLLATLCAFAAFAIDKAAAENGRWRIPENTLLALAAIGGSLGALTGQQAMRHKTRKQPFRSILIAIALLHIAFAIVMIYVGVMLMLMPRGIPQAPAEGTTGRKVSTVIIWLFIAVVAANVVAIIFLEGFAAVLPDDPTSYTLIDQIRGR